MKILIVTLAFFLALIAACSDTRLDKPQADNYLVVREDGAKAILSHGEFWSEVAIVPPVVSGYQIRTVQYMEPRTPRPEMLAVSYQSEKSTPDVSLTLSTGSIGRLGGTREVDFDGVPVQVQIANAGGPASLIWEACGLSLLLTVQNATDDPIMIAAPLVEDLARCE